jgi:putative inorganic carbon (hco3(-)) transporter
MVERRCLPASTARRADLAAVLSAIALASWASWVAGGRSTPMVLLLVGLAGAVALGRHLTAWPGLVPKAVAAAIAGAFALTYPGLLGGGGAPTGYANTNATLAAVGAVSAVAAARQVPPGPDRQAWTGLAVGLAAVVLLTRSTAGGIVLLLVGALLISGLRSRWPPIAAVGGAIAVSLALGITTAMAVDDTFPLASSDLVRVELWSAAVDLAQEEPIRGLGAGAFEDRNPVTRDADLRWVHHEYLEIAVELGGVGLLLVVVLGLATLLRLAAAGRGGLVGSAALTIVALHGVVDHIWHAPVVLLMAALLVGDGIRSTSRDHQPPAVAAEQADRA